MEIASRLEEFLGVNPLSPLQEIFGKREKSKLDLVESFDTVEISFEARRLYAESQLSNAEEANLVQDTKANLGNASQTIPDEAMPNGGSAGGAGGGGASGSSSSESVQAQISALQAQIVTLQASAQNGDTAAMAQISALQAQITALEAQLVA